MPEAFAPDVTALGGRPRVRLGLLSAVILMHAAALAALWRFTWEGLGTACFLVVLTGPVGISAGYHRLLSHRSYQVPRPVRYLLAVCGCLALQSSPLRWVAVHRAHHRHADRDGDPHTPRKGWLWAHMGWVFYPYFTDPQAQAKWVADLMRDKGLRLIDRHYFLINALFFGLVLLGAFTWGGWGTAVSVAAWGFAVRIVYLWHSTFLINSVTHFWGYRSYDTPDDSRNNYLIGILGYGEGWHNNHHARPRLAKFGHQWYELDGSYYVIRVLELARLAHHVRRLRAHRAGQRAPSSEVRHG